MPAEDDHLTAGARPAGPRPRRGVRAPLLAFLAGVACIVGAWVFAAPEAAGPDEPSHYIKAVGLGQGELVGKPLPIEWLRQIYTPLQAEQALRSNRDFAIPKGLGYQTTFPCHAFQATVNAGCLGTDVAELAADRIGSGAGAYPPLHYAVPGVASRFADTRIGAVRLTRLGGAIVCLLLLGLAAWALYDPRRPALSLVGPALATTPMLVFLSGTLSPSATETAASLAFLAGLLRILREERPRLLLWALAGGAGFVLALSRPEAPLFVAWDVLLAVWMAGPRRVLALVRAHRRGALALAAGAFGGSLLTVIWSFAVGLSAPISVGRGIEVMQGIPGQLRTIFQQMVGVFGWQDTFMPGWTYWTWIGMIAVLVAWAVWRGRARERALLVFAAAMSVGLVFLLAALIDQYGFGMQGRYVLPGAAVVPLLASDVLLRRGPGVPAPVAAVLGAAAIGVMACIHVVGFAFTARRYAVGTQGPLNFLDVGHWLPLGGWWPWLLMVVLGIQLVLVAAIVALRAGVARPVRS